MKHLFNKVFFHLESCGNDSTKTRLTEIPEDLSHRRSKKLFLSLTNVLSYPGLVNILKPITRPNALSPKQEKKEPDIPFKKLLKLNNFNEFMNYLVLVDNDWKQKILIHPDQSNLFGLHVLGLLCTCLDTALLLQTKYHFQETCLKLQQEVLLDDGSYVIDQTSIKRNQILVQVFQIGGPTERIVPPDELNEVGSIFGFCMIKLSLKQMKNRRESFVAIIAAVVISYLHAISESSYQSPLDNLDTSSRFLEFVSRTWRISFVLL